MSKAREIRPEDELWTADESAADAYCEEIRAAGRTPYKFYHGPPIDNGPVLYRVVPSFVKS